MTNERYLEIVTRRTKLKGEVSTAKGKEYSGPVDRLHNFKRIAEFARVSPEQACLVLMGKHVISIVDHIVYGLPITQAWIDEKVGDTGVYTDLLEALFVERMEQQNEN